MHTYTHKRTFHLYAWNYTFYLCHITHIQHTYPPHPHARSLFLSVFVTQIHTHTHTHTHTHIHTKKVRSIFASSLALVKAAFSFFNSSSSLCVCVSACFSCCSFC